MVRVILVDLGTLWQRPLGGKILFLAANEQVVVAVVMDEGTCSCLSFWLWSGALVVPRLALPGTPAAVVLSPSSHLLFVGTNARVAVWDLLRRKSVLQVSASEVLCSSSSLARAALVGEGQIPALILASGVCFSYCSDLSAWVCVADGPKHELSDFQGPSTAALELFGGKAPLANVQAMASSANFGELTAAAAHLLGNRSSMETTLAHLESQVLASYHLQSFVEMRYWVQQYAAQLVRYLADAIEDVGGPKPVEKARLRSLCEFLMGARGLAVDDDAKQRRSLLKEVVLPILSTNASLSSWVQKYNLELN